MNLSLVKHTSTEVSLKVTSGLSPEWSVTAVSKINNTNSPILNTTNKYYITTKYKLKKCKLQIYIKFQLPLRAQVSVSMFLIILSLQLRISKHQSVFMNNLTIIAFLPLLHLGLPQVQPPRKSWFLVHNYIPPTNWTMLLLLHYLVVNNNCPHL